MKTKLQALIAEQKTLTARFEELLYSTTEKSSTLDPKKVYIKGHPTRGAEVIKMLKDLGGIDNGWCKGSDDNLVYFINYKRNWSIDWLLVEDFRKISKEYTELCLPEEVSAENTQNTDIKVGDWIWIDDIVGYDEDGVGHRVVNNNPHYVVQVEPDGIFVVFEEEHLLIDFSDKFHKVEPPKEKFELIEGEVYANKCGTVFIFHQLNKFGGADIYARLNLSGRLLYCESVNINYLFVATPEQRKQLFDALEKEGKHFDKENMRLLDVEEWSCEKGEAFIGKFVEGAKWATEVFTGHIFEDGLEAENGGTYISIPYNDQTKKLIGTTDNTDKHYKFVNK